ncbi:hypothetical protein C2S52_023376 [Perilla frutescens var. hirtella]|uniref:Bifunctional inhibitor/plant lipid transfer protein/seed storage helical domain-containing protein n=1 Tax=Perilla frutescens var. hirtella TaxID=608512 RepID=A0AAD4IUS9_PERFH|nr:hypothetical protein C2S52_023376 [Perilla frutescens var. hirtella]KAH6821689.1 hypothetical protein C2S53_015446 [Perilla frutescens var. hirtella]
MNELRFCIGYLNNTSQPPDTCCQPLDYIVKSLPQCFCNLISTLGINRVELESEPSDISRAQTLPGRCGQRINPLECFTGTTDARSNYPTSKSANSKLWDGFVITMATSLTIFGFLAL